MNAIPSPVQGLGNVYVASGYRGRAMYAIKLGSQGDITDTDSIAWKVNRSTPTSLRCFFIKSGFISLAPIKPGFPVTMQWMGSLTL